jgi:hypothetical protein
LSHSPWWSSGHRGFEPEKLLPALFHNFMEGVSRRLFILGVGSSPYTGVNTGTSPESLQASRPSLFRRKMKFRSHLFISPGDLKVESYRRFAPP